MCFRIQLYYHRTYKFAGIKKQCPETTDSNEKLVTYVTSESKELKRLKKKSIADVFLQFKVKGTTKSPPNVM